VAKKKPEKKVKKDRYALVPTDDPAYRLMGEIRAASHSTLEGVDIVLVWERGIKPDRDGHYVLGRCRKVTDLEKQFRKHDFTILLNEEAWAVAHEDMKKAVLDHELAHAGVCSRDDGEKRFYVRKHDLEDFEEIVKRHGLWNSQTQNFVCAALERSQLEIFAEEKPESRRKIAARAVAAIQQLRERTAGFKVLAT
jgi:hypothetical protein